MSTPNVNVNTGLANMATGYYNNQGNPGYASVVPNAEKASFFDRAIPASVQAQRRKDRQKEMAFKFLQPQSTFKPYQSSANQILENKIAELSKQDEINPLDYAQTAVKYSEAISLANQLEKNITDVSRTYKQDKEINYDEAAVGLYNKYVGNGSLNELYDNAVKPVEGDFFLKELGGSKYLNTDKVLSNSLVNFGDVLKVAADQKAAKQVTPTLLRYDLEQVETLAKNLIEFDANGKPFVRDIKSLSDSGYFDILIDQNDRVRRIVWDNIADRTGNYVPTKKEQKEELLRLLDPYLITKQSSKTSTNYQRFTQYRPPSSSSSRSGGGSGSSESFNNWYRDLMTGKEEAPTYLKGTTLKASDLPLPKALTQQLGDKKLTISEAEYTEAPDYSGMSGGEIANALGFGLDVPKSPAIKLQIQPEGDADGLGALLGENGMKEIVIPLNELKNLSKAQLLYGRGKKGNNNQHYLSSKGLGGAKGQVFDISNF